MSRPWDYIAKLVCIGDSGCGKSSLTIRLCEGRFSAQHDVTIGVEFGSCIVPVGGTSQHPSSSPTTATGTNHRSLSSSSSQTSPPIRKHMKLSLWDTAGQETYKSVTRSYFRGASGALLVFDLTRRESFGHVTDWLNDLRQIAEPDIVVVLVGNKSDLVLASTDPDSTNDDDDDDHVQGDTHKRQVSRQEAERWCADNGVLRYVETSAKNGQNVERAFLELANRIYENIEAGKYDLNDRRSGVKGPGAGVGAVGGRSPVRTVALEMNNPSRPWRAGGGGCC